MSSDKGLPYVDDNRGLEPQQQRNCSMNEQDIAKTVKAVASIASSVSQWTTEHQLTNILWNKGVSLRSFNFRQHWSSSFDKYGLSRDLFLVRKQWAGLDSGPGRFDKQWIYKYRYADSGIDICQECGQLAHLRTWGENMTSCSDMLTCNFVFQWRLWVQSGMRSFFKYAQKQKTVTLEELQAIDQSKLPPAPLFWLKWEIEERLYFIDTPRPVYGGALKEVEEIAEMLKKHKTKEK